MAYPAMSVDEAARQLRVLKISLEEADRRDVKPMREELEQLHHVVVELCSAGYRLCPVYWRSGREFEISPHAFQVLSQVDFLIEYLDYNPTAPSPSSEDVIKDGMSPEEALPHLRALEKSFQEADKRKVLPNPQEIYNFRFIVVSLQVAKYRAEVSLPRSEDPQSPYYPKAFQVMIHVESLINSLQGAQPYSLDENVKRVPGLMKRLGDASHLLKEDRFTEYRRAILKLCRENQGPELQRLIANTVAREEKMFASVEAARKAIKLADEDPSQSPGKNASMKVLLATLNKHKISEGTSRHRFGLALKMLKNLGEYEYEVAEYPGDNQTPNAQQ